MLSFFMASVIIKGSVLSGVALFLDAAANGYDTFCWLADVCILLAACLPTV